MSLLLRTCIAFLLFTASLLKSIDFVNSSRSLTGMSLTDFFNLVIAQFELAGAILLFCSVYLRWTRLVLTFAFFCFMCKALYLLWAAKATCGCFGAQVHVPPWIMFLVDATFLVILMQPLLHLKGWSKQTA